MGTKRTLAGSGSAIGSAGRSWPEAASPCDGMTGDEPLHEPLPLPLPPGRRRQPPVVAAPRRLPRMSLHKSSGQARVVLAGKEHYLGKWGTPDAHAKYAALMRAWVDSGGVPPPQHQAPTVVEATYRVRDLQRDYLAFLDATGRHQKHGVPTSQRVYVEITLRAFCAFAGELPVHRLRESLLVQWRDRLEGNAKLTRNGINRKVRTLLGVLRWGRARGHVTREAWADCAAIEPLRRGQCGSRPERGRPRRAPSFDEIERVAAACKSRQVAAMLRLQALTAMRPGEVAAMRWQDIDQRPVQAAEGVACWTYHVAAPKTEHHGRTVKYYLPPAAQAILREFPGLPGAYVFSVEAAMHERRQRLRANRQTPVTDSTRRIDAARSRVFGARWSSQAYLHHVERACVTAGVDRFTPHEVRHAALTWVANHIGVTAAMAVANHASAQVTARYVHRDEAQALAAVAAVQRRAGGG